MKKILFFTIMLVGAAQLWAAGISETAALDKARAFLKAESATGKHLPSMNSSRNLRLAWTCVTSNHENAYYVFNADAAFVIVAGDDRCREILAYGDYPLDRNSIPANMEYWLSCYDRQMSFLLSHPDLTLPPMTAGSGQSVNPMITANWSQNAPYWNECPAFGSDTCYTGCPATSLAMVFHYWKYPQHQTPEVPSYVIPTYGVTLPSLPPTVFDWSNMIDNYAGGNYTPQQAAAVAHLMRYIGQVEEMDYTISGSGAYLKDIERAVRFFEYDPNSVQMLYKSDELGYVNYTDSQWETLMQAELTAGRPIVYCAYDNATGSGHAFNVDGYDATDGTYHINWGWNGRGNGNFVLNAFSYGDYTFGTAQQMVIGIQPPAGYQDPRLQAYPTTLDMQAYPGKPATAVFTLKGTNLHDGVTLTLDDADGVFTLDATSLATAVAEGGKDIRVTYAPQAVGSSTATITCTSDGANVLTITLNGTAPLEVYDPVMLPVDAADVTATSFRAQWADETPVHNVTGYTLEVYTKPASILLQTADFSTLPKETPTNQASHATDYLPDGWSFTGSEFNLEGGCIMPRRGGVITTDALSLKGYDKVTVVVTGRSYGSWGDPSQLTISTSLASQVIDFPFYYAPVTVVLDAAEGDALSFKAGYYPMIQKIEIYAGDATATLRASESGDSNYRLIEGIDPAARAYTVRDLEPGGSYFGHIMAHYIDGTTSPWSETQLVTLPAGGHSYEPGDVDHDGAVTIADVTILIDYLLAGTTPLCQDCADMDNSGTVTISDVTILIDLLLSGN